jgi:hypothetical protein
VSLQIRCVCKIAASVHVGLVRPARSVSSSAIIAIVLVVVVVSGSGSGNGSAPMCPYTPDCGERTFAFSVNCELIASLLVDSRYSPRVLAYPPAVASLQYIQDVSPHPCVHIHQIATIAKSRLLNGKDEFEKNCSSS